MVQGSVVAVILGLWLTAGVWGPRPPAGDDVMALLVRADRGIDITTSGHLDGWSPDFMLGYPQYLYYGPGFAWLIGIVRLLTFGLLSTEGALKVVDVISFVAVAPAAAFLARGAGLSRRGAGIAAVLALAVDNVFGVGLAAIFTIALVPHQIAASLFCIALGASLRTLVDPRRRWPVLVATSIGLTIITHPITTVVLAMFLAVGLPFLLLTDKLRTRAVGRLAAGGVGGLALSAFWVLPYVTHLDGRGEITAWGIPPIGDRLQSVLDGTFLFGPYVGWAVVAGLLYGVFRAIERRRWAAMLVVVPVVFMTAAHTMASRWPRFELSPQLANRGLGYAALVAVLPLAALVGRLSRPIGRAATPVALVAAIMLVVFVPGSPAREAKQMGEAVPQMHEAARRLRDLVPDGARFVTQRDFPDEIGRTGVSHPDFWLARVARRNTLNIFGIESSSSPAAGGVAELLGREPADATGARSPVWASPTS